MMMMMMISMFRQQQSAKNARNDVPILFQNMALRVPLRIVARAQMLQAPYELTLIHLLPTTVVPLHHSLSQHTQYFIRWINK
jgi:hypothetical protein